MSRPLIFSIGDKMEHQQAASIAEQIETLSRFSGLLLQPLDHKYSNIYCKNGIYEYATLTKVQHRG